MEKKLRVLAVIDTRQKDEHGFVIPNSGDDKPCDQCGRPHEVHWHLSDGRVVGQSCAKKLRVTDWGNRFVIRHMESLIGNASEREELQDINAGWQQSLVRWAERFPLGVIEVVDQVTGMFRVVVAAGKVNIFAPWQYRE